MKKIAVLIAAMLLGSDVALHAMDEKTDNNTQEKIEQTELEEEFSFAMFFDLLSDKTSEKLNEFSCPNIKKNLGQLEKVAARFVDCSAEKMSELLEKVFDAKENSDETSDNEVSADRQNMLTTMLASIEARDKHVEELELELLNYKAIVQAMQDLENSV